MSKIKLALDVVSDLKSLAESIEILVHAMESNEPNLENEVAKEAVKETKKRTKTKPTPEPVNDEPEEQAPEEKPITLEEVRAAMADKSRDGHREVVKAIITKYGANNLSALDPKHYAAALKEVGELK
jgi:hypothetical protein